jgi:hypothetical protein
MIHPATDLRFVNDIIGLGVFAIADIPKGTIVYAKDCFDIELTPEAFAELRPPLQTLAERYSYLDERGVRIISWDHAKYVNHRCDCNTMSTGYGFEIALRDISAGEEITDEYGLFNMDQEIELACGCEGCRGVLRPDDIETWFPVWDARVKEALACLRRVPQPLWAVLEEDIRREVEAYLGGKAGYRSVLSLRLPQPARLRASVA